MTDTVYTYIIMQYLGCDNVETQDVASLQKQHDTVYTHIMMQYRGFRNVETQNVASLQQAQHAQITIYIYKKWRFYEHPYC